MQSDACGSPEPVERALRAIGPAGCETSLIDLVLLACELSDDPGEVNDMVDGLIRRGAARVLPGRRDPMLSRLEAAA